MRLVTSLLALAAAAAASPLLSQQDDSARVWLSAVPGNVTFVCRGRIPGYYADVDSGCQMYHMCDPQSRRYSYLCPAFTEFSQFYMTCVQHDRVNCSMSESFFHMNEMIGRPRTRFHDLRQHDHSKKKDTEGSKASNRVEASEPAGHVLFEFETKMEVPVRKVTRPRTPSTRRDRVPDRRRTGGAAAAERTTERQPPASRSPPPTAAPRHRLFKTLSPPDPARGSPTSTTERSASHQSASTARRVKPRVRFSDIAGSAATSAAPPVTPLASTTPSPPAQSAPSGPALPQNTYRTFGLPGSFSFGTLVGRDKKADASPSPRPATASPEPTAAPSTSVSTTGATSTTVSTTGATSTKATTEAAKQAKSTAVSAAFGTLGTTTEASKATVNLTTTAKPWHLRPRTRLNSTAKQEPILTTTPRSSSQSRTESTPTRPPTTQSPTTQSATPTRATTPPTTQHSTTPSTTTPTTRKTTPARQTTTEPPTKTTAEPTSRKPTTAKPTTAPTTTRNPTAAHTTLARSRSSQNASEPTTASPSTARPSARPRPSASTPRPAIRAPPVPSVLDKELPPSGELEALRLSFTLEPPQLATRPDGPHEERSLKVRGELITGEMALRKLMVDQLKPVYFPDPSLPLNLLPPLLSEQEAADGRQTTTLTLPVRRQRPDALLQAAAVAFNILPPELASLVPPMLTPPPGRPSARATPATSAAASSATSADTSGHADEKRKGHSGLTMKFGKSKTPFRVGGTHGSPKDACYPCMKSFIKDLDRCHPCVIIR